ncbi:MAG: cytochrome P450 [Acidobacteria bacterium]|nr:cytochrome P450 [Acidobacteriota bacterium]
MTPDDALNEILLTAEGHADPYSRYRFLHDNAPAHRAPDGTLFLSGFADCHEVLRHESFGKAEGFLQRSDRTSADSSITLEDPNARTMLDLNPPDHTRIRGLVSRAFTPRRMKNLTPHIEALAEECFDTIAEMGEVDLLEAVGFPLPVAVIGDLVGVPRADWAKFRSLVTSSAMSIEPTATPEELETASESAAEIYLYFLDLVAKKRADPADDLLSAMLMESDGDQDSLSESEAIINAMLMFAAGFETTTNLIGNGMAALLVQPDAVAELREQPDLVGSAVEEMLRFDSPVQLDARSVLVPAQIAGVDLDVGANVVTLLGAANRDPTQFTEPERFDIHRDEGPPMSFGSGIHYCLGANLARVEGRTVVAGLLRRFSSIELSGPLVNRQRLTLRGYEAVPIKVTVNS